MSQGIAGLPEASIVKITGPSLALDKSRLTPLTIHFRGVPAGEEVGIDATCRARDHHGREPAEPYNADTRLVVFVSLTCAQTGAPLVKCEACCRNQKAIRLGRRKSDKEHYGSKTTKHWTEEDDKHNAQIIQLRASDPAKEGAHPRCAIVDEEGCAHFKFAVFCNVSAVANHANHGTPHGAPHPGCRGATLTIGLRGGNEVTMSPVVVRLPPEQRRTKPTKRPVEEVAVAEGEKDEVAPPPPRKKQRKEQHDEQPAKPKKAKKPKPAPPPEPEKGSMASFLQLGELTHELALDAHRAYDLNYGLYFPSVLSEPWTLADLTDTSGQNLRALVRITIVICGLPYLHGRFTTPALWESVQDALELAYAGREVTPAEYQPLLLEAMMRMALFEAIYRGPVQIEPYLTRAYHLIDLEHTPPDLISSVYWLKSAMPAQLPAEIITMGEWARDHNGALYLQLEVTRLAAAIIRDDRVCPSWEPRVVAVRYFMEQLPGHLEDEPGQHPFVATSHAALKLAEHAMAKGREGKDNGSLELYLGCASFEGEQTPLPLVGPLLLAAAVLLRGMIEPALGSVIGLLKVIIGRLVSALEMQWMRPFVDALIIGNYRQLEGALYIAPWIATNFVPPV